MMQAALVSIFSHVIRELAELARGDLSREQGALLLGKRLADGIIEVRAWLEIPVSEPSRVNFSMGQETWSDAIIRAKEEYPSLEIVGWAHTHPGFGAFLSFYDRMLHRKFFQPEEHIAVVVDPIAKAVKCFKWRRDGIKEVAFRIVKEQEPHEESPGRQVVPIPISQKVTNASPKKGSWLPWVAVALIVVTAFALVVKTAFGPSLDTPVSSPEVIILHDSASEAPLVPVVEDAVAMLPKEETASSAETPEAPRASSREYLWISVQVRKGDNLHWLMERFNIDRSLMPLIVERNNLADPNFLKVEQILLLPVKPAEY